jgi:hypothetical protein
MSGDIAGGGSAPWGLTLRGRRDEYAVLEGARAGQSAALVLEGEPGVGKTALLEPAIAAASDLSVLRAVRVEAEMKLAFAALHQLARPHLIASSAFPQRDVL